MSSTSENNKRIAKNTLLLYVRMLFIMVVSLFTSRVVLNVLGIEDYGINNVVGGVVAMFGFINAALSTGTQRYLTFELGKKDILQLQKVFGTSVIIHGLISILILVLAETVGLWFMSTQLTIPEYRMDAAMWIYQCSIFSAIIMIMSVPYNATIIAHENMSAFAYISVLEVSLKLLIIYLLYIGDFDKLKLYAVLVLCVQALITSVYGIYCKRRFAESKFRMQWDRMLIKEMLSFAGWNLWGNCAAVAFTQGVNILLNIFFGPAVNAARGISVQVQGSITQFSANFQTALNPQIIKTYANSELDRMHSLIYRSSKFTFFLLSFLAIPVFLETEMILKVWLGIVPDYTVVFLRLMLCVTIIDAVANPLMVSAAATGKVRVYQSVVGGLLLAILPISYIVLKLGGEPASVFIVHLCICTLAFVVRLFIIRPMIRLKISNYCKSVIFVCMLTMAIAIIPPLLAHLYLPSGIMSIFVVGVVSTISVSGTVYSLGLTKHEREFVVDKLATILRRIKKG